MALVFSYMTMIMISAQTVVQKVESMSLHRSKLEVMFGLALVQLFCVGQKLPITV